jgi:CMP-N-acetylneuraminic acid synthetase
MNVTIITARAGSKSIINKNVYPVAGHPMIYYPIKASLEAKLIDEVWISTDGAEIAAVGREMGCKIIDRPDELGGDHVNHGDVIKHAVEHVDARVKGLANIALLLGNTVMLDAEMLDQALGMLDQRKDLDSVMTVWEAADDHPLRALKINDDGLVEVYQERPASTSTERQSYKKAYYFDQGVFAFRKECVQHRDGPSPWWWMGKRSLPIIRPWITGRDVNGMFDVPFHEWWVQNPDIVKRIKDLT